MGLPIERDSDIRHLDAVIARFGRYIRCPGRHDCWLWTGATDKDGYGFLCYSAHDGKKANIRAHRLAYILSYGFLEHHLLVCHRCDTPQCCNPAHLFKGTVADNNADRNAKGRQARGANAGAARHKVRICGERVNHSRLTEEQAYSVLRRVGSGESMASVGRALGISTTAVRYIVIGQNWKYLDRAVV